MNQYQWLENRSVLITGGSGSFGKAFAQRLLTETKCSRVIILSRDEWKQWEMQQNNPLFKDPRVRYFIGNVRDAHRLHRAFSGVDYVVHAAALKQVPIAEYNPSEFVNTNVNGAQNVIDAAIDCGVKQVIALSTDKAVNPVNLYGATKLCSDKLFVHGNAYVGAQGHPKFAVVRYGNVLASRGSIIPMWRQMLKEGAVSLPVTDPRMTRFWITLDQAVDFVLSSFERMCGGEIFVPKLPSMKISELAEAIAPGIPKDIVGIREGEKLHELMISCDDTRHTLEFANQFVIYPEASYDTSWLEKSPYASEGIKPKEGFSYSSDNNTEWLDAKGLREMLNRISNPTEVDKVLESTR
jgi:UDP-N-acetylglucosamine 4,6-dehydratase